MKPPERCRGRQEGRPPPLSRAGPERSRGAGSTGRGASRRVSRGLGGRAAPRHRAPTRGASTLETPRSIGPAAATRRAGIRGPSRNRARFASGPRPRASR
ncbi:hypothetical protein PSMK_11170 [Phycisphaera mikurensis NBRC 102666]|uniref:Uncharacterized protein n=1 Tax=Phycisphaera mikurensis (strain NBRC 102666 / KCTC 22515 / FYK2301M01) TaxID=1142394 RepID=I0IDD8_PHYMF|nr:hypothetical protein PSMK_11170 [Phycisphaera mikurensis NBRC 102666]